MAAKHRDRCHGLYYAALRADKKFDRMLKKHHGPRATRWTVSAANLAAPVRRALARLQAVGKARARACDVMRRG